MPMLASNYIPEGMSLVLQSENGVLGLVSISERGLVILQDLATRSIQTFSRATLSKKYLLTVPSEEGFVNCGYIFTEASDISLNGPPTPHPPTGNAQWPSSGYLFNFREISLYLLPPGEHLVPRQFQGLHIH